MPARSLHSLSCALLSLLVGFVPSSVCDARPEQNVRSGTVTISVTPGQPANTFAPHQALGAAVDGLGKGDVARVYTPANIRAMRSAGLRPLTYRLRTELGVEAWHWNPEGTWSDSVHQQGYWTSSDHASGPVQTCYGYCLPRRGSTIDQANNDGYSRLDDGDPETFWKSNPYLDRHYTRENNARHPQWFIIDLGRKQSVDAIRLCWAVPYATRYAVEYSTRSDAISIDDNMGGRWETFPHGVVTRGTGGDVLLKLCDAPLSVRFVRVVMTASSDRLPARAKDIRDGLGYAVGEVYLGTVDAQGRLHDLIRHGKSNKTQTVIYASSTDPWHRASDLDTKVEQPGFDRIFQSGLTSGLPLLTPVGLLYDTPENAASEIRFLRSRGYPVRQIEMGEEPDGQYTTPEDYGAFYVRWADLLHKVDPRLQLGGPCFQSNVDDVRIWPDRRGNRSWMNRFLNYLRTHHHSADFRFYSFEWYPFDDVCAPTAPQLVRAPDLLAGWIGRLEREGLSRGIPWLMTEYGYSAFAGQAEVDVAGALLNADIVGKFLTLGGDAAYLYGYEPNTLVRELPECNTWGNLALFLADNRRVIRHPLPAYYGACLLSQQWVLPGHGVHEVYPAACDITNRSGQALVTAYAVHRPDGQWALMLINKDPLHAWTVRVRFTNTRTGATTTLRGPFVLYRYSSRQYVWMPQGDHGRPARCLPPEHTILAGRADATIELPPYSLSVVRGRGLQTTGRG